MSASGEPQEWPQPLHTVEGPFRAARIDGAAAGMGNHGPATRELIEAGGLPPDQLCGLTLFLLARQRDVVPEPGPASARSGQSSPGRAKASPIEGGVWVREQFTIHRPMGRHERFEVSGAAEGRFVRKGRRYGLTASHTRDEAGRAVATNLTCGLLSYRAEAGDDQVEGRSVEEVPGPSADRGAAAANPALDVLGTTETDQIFGAEPMVLSLAMMAARDTANPDNPIHSDVEAAAAAGLARPIAGGNHVLSFAIEPLLAAWGPEALCHGTRFDIRWRAPVEADAEIVPSAIVTSMDDRRIVLSLEVTLSSSGVAAMVGSLEVPLSP